MTKSKKESSRALPCFGKSRAEQTKFQLQLSNASRKAKRIADADKAARKAKAIADADNAAAAATVKAIAAANVLREAEIAWKQAEQERINAESIVVRGHLKYLSTLNKGLSRCFGRRTTWEQRIDDSDLEDRDKPKLKRRFKIEGLKSKIVKAEGLLADAVKRLGLDYKDIEVRKVAGLADDYKVDYKGRGQYWASLLKAEGMAWSKATPTAPAT